jgi:hypothetical protein
LKRFRYSADPLCLMAATCYAANRWLVPAALKGVFLRGYFADLLLIPAALPVMLWLQRRFGLRSHDAPPTLREVWVHVLVWSVAAEGVAPFLFGRATGDWWDVAAYASGAVVALSFWTME